MRLRDERLERRIQDRLVRHGGLLLSGDLPSATLSRAAAEGRLQKLLPGMYCRPGAEADVELRARAALARDPDGVIVGRAAARLTWWPELSVREVEVSRTIAPALAPGYVWSRRAISPEHVVEAGALRLSCPALSVLDLMPVLGGRAIDEALRRRAVTLEGLWTTLAETPRRDGNEARARLLHDSRDEPWSEAERAFHRLVRGLRLPWAFRTNHAVRLADGCAFIDVALPALRLGFEVDGYGYHGDSVSFVGNRVRDLNLALLDWELHRFAAVTVEDHPDLVASSVDALARRRAALLARAGRWVG